MRSFLVALATLALVVSAYSTASAADDKKLTPQQEKMKSCNTQAADKKGMNGRPSCQVVSRPAPQPPP